MSQSTPSAYGSQIERQRQYDRIDDALRGSYPATPILYQQVQDAMAAAKFPNSTKFATSIGSAYFEQCEARGIKPAHDAIVKQMVISTAILYGAEMFTTLPDLSNYQGTVADGFIRDKLIQAFVKATDPAILEKFRNSVLSSFMALTNYLPEMALDGAINEEVPNIPLYDLITNPGPIIEDMLAAFGDGADSGLFSWLRSYLRANIERVSERSRGKTVYPTDFKGTPRELIHAYLRETPLEDLFNVTVPVVIPDETRFGGTWCIAPPGRGKTTLLHSMVLSDLAEEEGSVILMDSKGDLIEPFTKLAEIKDRLVLVDPDPDHPIAINPLDIPHTSITHAVDLLEYLFGSLLEFKMTALQTTLFRSVLRALVTAFPNPTLETFRDVLTNGIEKYDQYIKQLSPDLQDFFYKEFNEKMYADRRREVVQRLRLLLDNDAMRAMLLAAKTRFDIGTAMDAGKVIIINNSKAKLGDQGAEFFGRFFIAQILAAAQQRSGRSYKRPVYVYIDEFHNVISRDERIPTILDECRSQKIALILAHQRTEQIKNPNVMSALSNCAIRYANSDDEARALAPKLRTTQEFLQSLRRGEFAAYIRDLTTSAIRLKVSPTDFAGFPTLTTTERASLKSSMSTLYGVIPEVRQISEAPKPAPPLETTAPPISKEPPQISPPKRSAEGESEAADEWG